MTPETADARLAELEEKVAAAKTREAHHQRQADQADRATTAIEEAYAHIKRIGAEQHREVANILGIEGEWGWEDLMGVARDLLAGRHVVQDRHLIHSYPDDARSRAVGALIAATAGDDPEHVVDLVLNAVAERGIAAAPDGQLAEHRDAITYALRHTLDAWKNAKGIGERTAAGSLQRALDWITGQPSAPRDPWQAVESVTDDTVKPSVETTVNATPAEALNRACGTCGTRLIGDEPGVPTRLPSGCEECSELLIEAAERGLLDVTLLPEIERLTAELAAVEQRTTTQDGGES